MPLTKGDGWDQAAPNKKGKRLHQKPLFDPGAERKGRVALYGVGVCVGVCSGWVQWVCAVGVYSRCVQWVCAVGVCSGCVQCFAARDDKVNVQLRRLG